MRKLKLLLAALALLAGGTTYAVDYKVDQRFTSIAELDGKLFAVVDETSEKAMGIGITGHGSGWDMYFGTYAEAYTSNACYYKIEPAQGEGVNGCYYLRTYKKMARCIQHGMLANLAISIHRQERVATLPLV